MREWISIRDKEPELDQYVLVYAVFGNNIFPEVREARWHDLYWKLELESGDKYFKSCISRGEIGCNIIAWMPLPERPSNE